MVEQNYSKRELDEKFDHLMEHMTSFEAETGASLMRIEKQTVKTNGYVADLIRWKWMLSGFCACLSMIVLPLLWALIQEGKL